MMRKLRIYLLYIVILIWVLLINVVGRQISITLEYAPQKNPDSIGLTTLYYNNGYGFKESDSIYQTVDNNLATYSFKPVGLVTGIRIIPIRDGSSSVHLKSLRVSVDGNTIRYVEGEQLLHSIWQERSAADIRAEDGMVTVSYRDGEPWPYVTWNLSICAAANLPGVFTLVKTVLCIAAFLLPNLILKQMEKRWIVSSETKTICSRIADLTALFTAVTLLVFELDFILGNGAKLARRPVDYLMLLAVGCVAAAAFSNVHESGNTRRGERMITIFLVVMITFSLYETMKLRLLDQSNVLGRMTTPVYLMNLFWGFMFLSALYGMLGNLGYCIYGIIWLVVLVGNGVKLYYHNTMLTPMDFLQLEEAFRIAGTILGSSASIVAVGILLAVLMFVIFTRKKWILFLKPSFRIGYVLVPGFLCIWLTRDVIQKQYEDRDIFHKGYENGIINERYDGVAFYNIINISKIGEMVMKEPADYGEDTVKQYLAAFSRLEVPYGEDVKPNVILIMAESLFDIEGVDGVTFDCEITPNLREYAEGMLISPRYGGYTSAVEYEALTGLTLAFYPPALVPYTIYFNQAERRIPSTACEFGKNGYKTYAIHPNEKTFYNRDVAYEMLGFDEFLHRETFDFSLENLVAGSFMKDMPVAEKITELIEIHEEPVFAFVATIAGHYMKEDRYEDPGVTAYHEGLDADALHELEQSAAAYKETDDMFAYLIDFIEASDEPTLLYVFGDHLPPMPVLGKLNYVNSLDRKYSTALSVYSNYKEIEILGSITPNQLAAQMMIDSGIEHSRYYDYIYSLREHYPVLHLEYLDVAQTEELEPYRMIQYDIMFGEQWFYEEERGENEE